VQDDPNSKSSRLRAKRHTPTQRSDLPHPFGPQGGRPIPPATSVSSRTRGARRGRGGPGTNRRARRIHRSLSDPSSSFSYGVLGLDGMRECVPGRECEAHLSMDRRLTLDGKGN
jgi:hypothetical protein